MPLPILLALVVGGIGGLVLLVHLLGWTKRPEFAGEHEARDGFLTDYPGADIRTVILAADKRAALLKTSGGWGYVALIGEGRLTRAWGGECSVERRGTSLRIRIDDFTAPALVFQAKDDTQAETLAGEIS